MYNFKIDEYDKKILDLLASNGRIKLKDLAESVGLSSPACHSRMLKLESYNFIKGYTALLNFKKLGFDILGIVFIKFEDHSKILYKTPPLSMKSIEDMKKIN